MASGRLLFLALLIGVKLNIPPFLRGKTQLSGKEMVETRRIASLRTHVEQTMERIKIFHIFDQALPSPFETAAEQVIFILIIYLTFILRFICKHIHEFYTAMCVYVL